MKYASELGGMSTSVHDWKPIPPEQFASLVHTYCTVCAAPDRLDQPKLSAVDGGERHWSGVDAQEGYGGLRPFALKLDRSTTATLYYMPKRGQAPDGVHSPVLLTVVMPDGKVICFKSLKHGLDSYGLGQRPVPFHHSDVETVESGVRLSTAPAS